MSAQCTRPKQPIESWRILPAYLQPLFAHTFSVPTFSSPSPEKISWWVPASEMFQSGSCVQRLAAVDPKSLAPEVLQKLQPFVEDPAFTVDAVGRVSSAAAQLCAWVRFTWSAAQPEEGE